MDSRDAEWKTGECLFQSPDKFSIELKLKKKTKPESFIQKPKYPGGKKVLDDFIRTNMRYPEEALEQRVEVL